MQRPFTVLLAIIALALSACAGKVDYIRPMAQTSPGANVKIIDKSRNAVWNASVPELGKQFFVINNIDKASGFMNVSYSGDPEKYIDCGRITSYVKNARGERNWDFAGASAQQSYEIMNPGTGLFFIDRKMALEGRVNLVFEEVSPTQTRVTANTRYIVNRTRTVRNAANNIPQTLTDSISFNSGGQADFPGDGNGRNASCVANGALEREILGAVR